MLVVVVCVVVILVVVALVVVMLVWLLVLPSSHLQWSLWLAVLVPLEPLAAQTLQCSHVAANLALGVAPPWLALVVCHCRIDQEVARPVWVLLGWAPWLVLLVLLWRSWLAMMMLPAPALPLPHPCPLLHQ